MGTCVQCPEGVVGRKSSPRGVCLPFAVQCFGPHVCGNTGEFGTLQALFGLSEGRVFVMAEDNRMNGFAWFLAGLGIGALTGILYAPKSGRETREDLANTPGERQQEKCGRAL